MKVLINEKDELFVGWDPRSNSTLPLFKPQPKKGESIQVWFMDEVEAIKMTSHILTLGIKVEIAELVISNQTIKQDH